MVTINKKYLPYLCAGVIFFGIFFPFAGLVFVIVIYFFARKARKEMEQVGRNTPSLKGTEK